MSSETLSFVVAATGILTSGILAFLAYVLNRQSQRTAIHRSIGDLYEKLMDFRAAHPEAMSLAKSWDDGCFSIIYNQENSKDKQWVIYYSFAELVLSFSNTVIYGWRSRALDRYAYEQHYKPLVRLLLTEHFPFLQTVKDGPYLSPLIKEFLVESEKDGWNWQERYKILTTNPLTPKASKSK